MTDDAEYINTLLSRKAGQGGRVVLEAGIYTCLSPIVLPNFVTLEGESMRGVSLKWPNDLGPGIAAITHPNPAYGQQDAAHIRELSILGPNWDSPVSGWGVRGALMDGFYPGPWTQMDKLLISGFDSCVGIRYDHNVIRSCIFGGFYGLSLHDNPVSKGGPSVYDSQITGSRMAAIRVSGDNNFDGAVFVNTHLGFSPYAVLKTDFADGRPATNGLGIAVDMFNTAFEYCGNAAIASHSPLRGDMLLNWRIHNPGFSWAWWARDPNHPADYAVDLPNCNVSMEITGQYPFTAGDKGIFNFWSGIVSTDRYLDRVMGTGQLATATDRGPSHGPVHCAGAAPWGTNTPVERGDLLSIVPGYGRVARANGGYVYGVALNDAGVDEWVHVARRGAGVAIRADGRVYPAGVGLKPSAGTPHHAEACDGSDPATIADATMELGPEGGLVDAILRF